MVVVVVVVSFIMGHFGVCPEEQRWPTTPVQ